MLPALCRGVRPVGQELPPVSMRLPGASWPKLGEAIMSSITDYPVIDMSVLLQQHQDDHERSVPSVPTPV